MNENENLTLMGIKLEMAIMTAEIQKLSTKVCCQASPVVMPEWVNLETAASMKGGAALSTYKTRLFLQPCCGLNSKSIAGRKCWRREDVILWLSITDADLKKYADEWKVEIPANYKDRSVK
jgi:hypothetical protein